MSGDFETNVSMLAEMGSQFPYKRNFRTVTGRYDTTTGLLQADPTSGLPAGWVWVMLQYGRMSVPAIAGVDTSRPGLPVWCGYNEGGSLCAWGAILSEETAVQFGGQLPALITPTAPAQQSNTPYAGALLDDLRLRWANAAGEPGGLYVTLDAGWIGGLYAYLQPQIALVPTSTSAASAWCVVCADRRDGSLSQFLLGDQFGSYTPTPASIAALSSAVIPGYLRAVGGVILTNGDTSLSGKMIVSMRDLTETRIKANTGAAVDPTSTDDVTLGYEFGSVWWNSTGGNLWLCVGAVASSALWQQINSAGGGGSFPQTASVWRDEFADVSGASVYAADVGQFGGIVYLTSPQATSAPWDAFEASIFIKAGTYTLYVLCFTDNGSAILDWTLDGGAIGTLDFYTLAPAPNSVLTVASVVVSTDGTHTLRGTVNSKNGSSSGYSIQITKVWLK